ncbi:MAG: hypothetical protein FWE16_03330 [Firmicutes bacterium]|nr:hypothetical protein [Bacillota bacterium]
MQQTALFNKLKKQCTYSQQEKQALQIYASIAYRMINKLSDKLPNPRITELFT